MTPPVRFLTIEDAMEEIEKLEGRTEEVSEGSQIFSGMHPVYGAIHIVLPLVGSGILLLPFALQQFS